MTKIAVVILNWNGKKLLQQFLPSITKYSSQAKIIIADNDSTDASIDFVKSNYPEIEIIKNKENGGFAKGYNDALKHIDSEYYCLLNSDVEVTANWLNPILQIFEKQPEVSIVQPKILDFKKKTHFEYAGAGGGYIDKLGYPFCKGRVFQILEEDKGQYNGTYEIFWATGACMFIKSTVFHDLGGFDEDYFAHQEEIDLCWRAKNYGHKIMYTGASSVYHLGGSTLNNMNPKKTYLNFRNSLFSLLKNAPASKLFFLIFRRLLLDGIAGVRFIFQGRLKHCLAILQAHFSFYVMFRKMLRKRNAPQYFKHYYEAKYIVWSHFINNIRYFKFLVKD